MDCAKLPSGVTAQWLLAERRLHLQHGPIDLIIEAEGESSECASAFRQAVNSFTSVLDSLVVELPLLRTPMNKLLATQDTLNGNIAKLMYNAVLPHASQFVTPMAAVAGAVADHVLAAMLQQRKLQRAFVNNGGDIAVYLSDQASYKVGLVSDLLTAKQQASITVTSKDNVRGIATSGWQGRSHSLGVADAVTVLAENAANADVAATLIANAVDIPDSNKIVRESAESLMPDSDLGELQVTTTVLPFSSSEKKAAVNAGLPIALQMIERGLINSACINVQGQQEIVGNDDSARLRNIA